MGIGPVDWYDEKRRIEASKAMGKFTYGGLRHGRTCIWMATYDCRWMIFGLFSGKPIENVKALMDAMEKYAGHFRYKAKEGTACQ